MTEEGPRDVADERPTRPPALALLESLHIYRHAKIGLAVGSGVALAAYLFRVLELFGPFTGTRSYPLLGAEGWFLLLAFVLAATSALLLTIALTVKTAIREARTLD